MDLKINDLVLLKHDTRPKLVIGINFDRMQFTYLVTGEKRNNNGIEVQRGLKLDNYIEDYNKLKFNIDKKHLGQYFLMANFHEIDKRIKAKCEICINL